MEAKLAAGETTIFRADREEASWMYQYGLMYDMLEDPFTSLAENIQVKDNGTRVRVRLTRENRPNSIASILSMIGDYGYNMDRMELLGEDETAKIVTFELLIIGNLSDTHMKKLMFQLSKESRNFAILECC